MNPELILSTQLHILTDASFCCLPVFESMEFRVAETIDGFYVV